MRRRQPVERPATRGRGNRPSSTSRAAVAAVEETRPGRRRPDARAGARARQGPQEVMPHALAALACERLGRARGRGPLTMRPRGAGDGQSRGRATGAASPHPAMAAGVLQRRPARRQAPPDQPGVATSPAVGYFVPGAGLAVGHEVRRRRRHRLGRGAGRAPGGRRARSTASSAGARVEAGQAVEYGQELVLVEDAAAPMPPTAVDGARPDVRDASSSPTGARSRCGLLRACRAMGISAVVAYSEADRDIARRAARGRGHLRRAGRVAPQLPVGAVDPVGGRRHGLRRHPSRLRLPVRGRRVRRDDARPRPDLHRPAAGGARALRLQGGHARAARRSTGCRPSRARRACCATTTTPSPRPSASATRCSSSRRPAAAARACAWCARRASCSRPSPSAARRRSAAFGDDSLYLEKWLEDNRHVEVQVVVDRYGNGVHVGERDCSVQRRHQKIVEEAPTPGARRRPPRRRSPSGAVAAVVAAGYENLGTLEFLVDGDGQLLLHRDQLPHPGRASGDRDAVRASTSWSSRSASPPASRWATPRRISSCAATPSSSASTPRMSAHDFRPQAGIVERYLAPGGPGVRMDSHLYSGYEVPPYYDSLLGKLIVWGEDRDSRHRARPGRARRAGHRRRRDQRRRSIGRCIDSRAVPRRASSRPTCSTASAAPRFLDGEPSRRVEPTGPRTDRSRRRRHCAAAASC